MKVSFEGFKKDPLTEFSPRCPLPEDRGSKSCFDVAEASKPSSVDVSNGDGRDSVTENNCVA